MLDEQKTKTQLLSELEELRGENERLHLMLNGPGKSAGDYEVHTDELEKKVTDHMGWF